MDTVSTLQGFSFTLPELHGEIAKTGWVVSKVKFDTKTNRYIATAKASHGEQLDSYGQNEQQALANLYLNITHRNHARSSKIASWTYTFTDQLGPIAEAYSKAPVYEMKAAAAFLELGKDSVRRAHELEDHLEIRITNNPEPYKSHEKLNDDVRKRRRLEVSRANIEHPIWSEEQALAFRICHDVLGYVAANSGWDWQGENEAFAAHASIIHEEAQKALFTQCIGHTAYATYYHAFGPQKVCLFPQFMDEAQDKMNPAKGYAGIHPSQTYAPVAVPAVKNDLKSSSISVPNNVTPRLSALRTAEIDPTLRDPNEGWQSGVQPLANNGYMYHSDPIESDKVRDTASLIDTEWSKMNQEDPQQLAEMKKAIVNAFRVVLLSPRKNLKWNAVHYQDISHIPGDESDPTNYWHALENARQNWNVERFGEDARYSHRPYAKFIKPLISVLYQQNPSAGHEAAEQEAFRFIQEQKTRIEDRLSREDEDNPEDKQRHLYQIENEANKELANFLKQYVSPNQTGMDFTAADEQMGFDMGEPEPVEGPSPTPNAPEQKPERYGAFMGTHLKAIAQISQHVDEILEAALYDVHEKDGSGHHFRATVLQLGISGVGPKVCSFAWLLLQPMTSQLGTIDTHMADVLGHNFEKELNNRDYFKWERELQAGRDAAGYGHMPLGQFQWGMWDYKRTGPGSHQDHSAMKVLNPVPHSSIDWADHFTPINVKAENWTNQVAPEWWRDTATAREAAAKQFDEQIAPKVPQNRFPFQSGPMPEGSSVYSKTAASTLVPVFTHPTTGATIKGSPGTTLMQHIRNTTGGEPTDVWSQMPDEAVSKI